jgi:hypothetical protein
LYPWHLEEILALTKDDDLMMVEAEEERMGVKLKALTGPEHLF